MVYTVVGGVYGYRAYTEGELAAGCEVLSCGGGVVGDGVAAGVPELYPEAVIGTGNFTGDSEPVRPVE